MSELNRFVGVIASMNPEAITLDNLDDAIIGIERRGQGGNRSVLIYSMSKIIDCLQKQGIKDRMNAIEYYDFNIGCLHAGPFTPKINEDEFNGTTQEEEKGRQEESGHLLPRLDGQAGDQP